MELFGDKAEITASVTLTDRHGTTMTVELPVIPETDERGRFVLHADLEAVKVAQDERTALGYWNGPTPPPRIVVGSR